MKVGMVYNVKLCHFQQVEVPADNLSIKYVMVNVNEGHFKRQ